MAHPSLPAQIPADMLSAIGVLNQIDQLGIEEMKLMILVEMAGEPLYGALADSIANPEAADLLRRNGREETAHAHRLKKAIEILTGEPFDLPPMAENPYAEIPDLGTPGPDLLESVRQGEISGDASYQRYAAAEANPEIAELLRQNGREEIRHGERVARAIEILRTD